MAEKLSFPRRGAKTQRKRRGSLILLSLCAFSAPLRLCGGGSLLLLMLPPTLAAQTDPARQFEAAMHREIVTGDVTGALADYRAIVASSNTPRPVAARALFQMGQCQEKLGQRKDAHATYARIAREFAGESEVAAQAQSRLEGWTDALPGPRNLRFEEGEVGKVPPGWYLLEVGQATGSFAE